MSQARAVVGAEQFDPGGRRVGLDADLWPVAAVDEGVLHQLADGRLQVGARMHLAAVVHIDLDGWTTTPSPAGRTRSCITRRRRRPP
ncbi:hypothetical protein BRC85_01180 [Halobacteriales archaeon QS_1_69_70]|nr:MAG: hypothetical protein BRC85_01180 [Halobacteriales archaeon QS_1_69_70]